MTKLTTAALALALLAGASGTALAQDHDRDHGAGQNAAQPQQNPGSPGGGRWQGGAPGGEHGGGRWQGGQPAPTVAPPGAPPQNTAPHDRSPGRQGPGAPPQAAPGAGAPHNWQRGPSEVTPPPPDGRNWEGRHDPRGSDGRNWDSRHDPRGPEGRGPDGRTFDGRGGDHHDGRGPGVDGRGPDHRDGGWNRGGPPQRWTPGRFPPTYWAPQRFRIGPYRAPYGYYVRSWNFGDFLPEAWFAQSYWIDDFEDYGLPYPPPGFEWVRVGPDAIMVDRYTGRIVQVVRGIFW